MHVKNCIIVCDGAQHTGGVSSVILEQAMGLTAKGLKVYVFTGHGPADPALTSCTDDIHYVDRLMQPRNRLREVWNKKSAIALKKYLCGFSPADTVVHVHSLSMVLSPSIFPAIRAKGFTFVISAHDAGWACPTGYFYNFKTSKVCNLKPLSSECLRTSCDKRAYVHKLFKAVKSVSLDYVSHAKRDASTIIVPSGLLQSRLACRIPRTTPMITVRNPVKINDQGPRGTLGEGFLFVGRIWEEKGILELLHTKGGRYPLTVIGDGPRLAELSNLYPTVRFKGWLEPKAVSEEMRQCTAVILPSIYVEAFGLVVAEALALGVPAIVTNRAGAAAMIEHGVNGFVVDMACLDELVIHERY